MKIKLMMGLILASTLFVSCTDGAVDEAEMEMNDQMNQQADSLELLDEEIEKTKQEIEASSKEVDELLKDL